MKLILLLLPVNQLFQLLIKKKGFGKWFSAMSLFLYMLGFSVGMGSTPWLHI